MAAIPDGVFLQYNAGTGQLVLGSLNVLLSSFLITLNRLVGGVILAELPETVRGPFGFTTNRKVC